ncbi:IS66 family transposase zinc-finger binding domain-containing protein [Phascolarctobacterium succinatutens]|uniref:IS66 family transposase zinc-finger binding domain-containing protein n=1 Tax=Phascolarctobacterium succinatutens TaxID=626940 RepID=UPI0026F176F7|nr:IS66 family transposase zinc-finger binding domain-containing protein [Phascolarctobacterium succinatutens]
MSVDTQLYNVYMSSKHIKKHEIGYNIVMENNTKTTKTIEISVAEYERLKNSEEELRQRVGLLEEALRLTKRKQFGSSSEKISPETKAQLIYLFDEAETVLAIEDIITEQEETKVTAHTRKKKTYLLQDKLPDNVEIEVIEHKLNEAERNCPECGAIMQEIGQEVRRELVIIPAKVKVLEHHIYSYVYQNCK